MAYPMVQWITFGDFRQRLEGEFDCRYVTDEQVSVNGTQFGELERAIGGRTRRYAVSYTDEYLLAPSVVRSICAHLHVNPVEFGLTIG